MEQKNGLLGRLDVKAFTLIELLVVVLIIGILAAVALPQYQKAVEKSRATQALTVLKTVAQAEESYFLANGSYAADLEQLAVDIPWTGNAEWRTGIRGYSNENWSLQLNYSYGVYLGRLSGKYTGVGFVYLWGATAPLLPYQGKIICAERVGNGIVYQGSEGSYCGKVIPVTSRKIYDDGGLRMWLM